MKTFQLKTPIDAHGESVHELTLREPTPADCRALKALPYMIGLDESFNLNTEIAARYISRCANIPASSVDALELSDFNALCWQVASFFMNGASRESTP